MCAPLRVGATVIGTVTAMRVRAGETYTRPDLRFLEELADRAAPAIENSRLHAEKRAVLARTEQLYHFAKAVVSAEKVDDVFESALDAIERGLGATRGAILVSDEQGVMRFRASRNLSPEYRAAVEGHSPWPRDAVAPEPVLVPDVESDQALRPFLPLFRREGIRSLAFIPLVTHGRLIGKFMVYFGQRHAYAAHEIDLASSLAHHLASVTARFAATAKLEETIRYNDLFAGVLAHDLRNPLSAMITAAQLVLMRQEGRSDGDAKSLSRIIASGKRMFRLIDQLLDVTRARVGGGIQLDPREANLSNLCDQAIAELEVANPDWIVRREAVGDPGGWWDPDRLLQIISNLVGNAGHHGEPGSPIVVRLDGARPDAITLEVRNQGVIPEAAMASLFAPLKGGTQRRDYARGLGLGLFIVKEMVQAHGGRVDVASSAGEGTAFTVTLPRRCPRSPALEQSAAHP
jgi:signal transduction histidine kinase